MKKVCKWTLIIALVFLLAPLLIVVSLYAITIKEDLKHLGEERVTVDEKTGKPVTHRDFFNRTAELTGVVIAGIYVLPSLVEPYWKLLVFKFQVNYGYFLAFVECCCDDFCMWCNAHTGVVVLAFILGVFVLTYTGIGFRNCTKKSTECLHDVEVEHVKDYEIMDCKQNLRKYCCKEFEDVECKPIKVVQVNHRNGMSRHLNSYYA